MDEKMSIRMLLTGIALSAFTACADESTTQSCSGFSDAAKTVALRAELDKVQVPYRVDGDSVCVTSKHRNQFIDAMLKVSPPDPSRKVDVPPSPSGAPVESARLADQKQQDMLEAELKKRKIWFSKDKSGMIWYEVAREKEVKEIIFRIVDSVTSQEITKGR